MKTIAGLLSALLLASLAAQGQTSTSDAVNPLLDATRDLVERRSFIPSERNVHGEFRLVRRGDATCAQTLLYTPSLRRAVQRIEKKERRAWSADDPAYSESQAYLNALEAAKDEVIRRFDALADPDDRRQKLMIEFVLGPDAAVVALFAIEIEGGGPDVRVTRREPLAQHPAAREYVARSIDLMTEAAFQPSADADDAEPRDR